MIYSHHNARGAIVHDVMAREQLNRVRLVDVEAGEVECYHDPLRVNHLGEADTYKVRFESIYPIFGGHHSPLLFHCYGRING